jgi:mercuric reductase
MSEKDLVIIGSGAAAFAAAITASRLGVKASLIEQDTIGGTCVNVGCIPSKTLLAAAKINSLATNNKFPGIFLSSKEPDIKQIISDKDNVVDMLRSEKYVDIAEFYGFEIIKASAHFKSPNSLDVGGKEIRFAKSIIATGASPFIPPIPGLSSVPYLTSKTALQINYLPKSIAIIGGNAIGLEFAQFFSDLNVSVSVIEVLDRLVPNEEPEVSQWIAQSLKKSCVEVFTSAQIKGISGKTSSKVITLDDGSVITADEILVATGRRPQTSGLNLESAGIQMSNNRLVLDKSLRTSNCNVWAAGDVTGGPQFVYVAAYQGEVAAKNAINDTEEAQDLSGIPRVIFTHPAVAAVGLTDEQAVESGIKCQCRVVDLGLVPRAVVSKVDLGGIKVVIDKEKNQIVGVSMVGDNAEEVIALATLAVKLKLSPEFIQNTWCPYLTMAEAFKIACQAFKSDVTKLSCCAV